MNDNDVMDNSDVLTDNDVSVANETTVTEEQGETEIPSVIIPGEEFDDFFGESDTGTGTGTDGNESESESTTDSSTVVDSSAECQFTDVNICNKLDIIIMLLIVIIAIKMFSPLANNHKRVVQKKEK